MAFSHDSLSMAVFCDFENVALGVRDANYEKFDIKPVLERLLLKGSIVVKKAYCDWDRYKSFKATMHESNFEMIEIPHVRQSGKNSADIRMVVDALDLCYTKAHVNTFVIISGDSDFSPLVSKLRENAKTVIGVGVKQSTSDLLIANCDEFIFYDDLVRERQRQAARRGSQPQQKRAPEESNRREEKSEAKKTEAIEMVVETFEALIAERGDSGKIWASLLKDTLKRRRPDFNETYYGFRSFGNLIEEAKARGLLEFGRDEKSGAYVYRASGAPATAAQAETAASLPQAELPVLEQDEEVATEQPAAAPEPRRGTRGGRKPRAASAGRAAGNAQEQPEATEATDAPAGPQAERPASGRRGARRGANAQPAAAAEAAPAAVPEAQSEPAAAEGAGVAVTERPKRARKTPARVAKAKAVQAAAAATEPPAAAAEVPTEAAAEDKPKRARKSAPRRPKTH